MVLTRKERKAANIKLAQPDRSGVPSEDTLLKLAQERDLFEQADERESKIKEEDEAEDDDTLISPTADRIMEAVLWSASLSMLHLTLDVLVQNQYAISIIWPQVIIRAMQAFAVFFLLIYVLHPHASVQKLLPGLPDRHQSTLRQAIFFISGTVSGCYLIHISNKYGYLAVMKQSPPLGCIWVWSVIELNLAPAVLSLAITGGFFHQGGYTVKAPY
ncbi:hypothetical protein GGR53DRAFT_239448 [Hypoxylon sp. FL1150]|nr:hypothetical protein GGR53DRAFT_239448 [Hypoxylon sp. FL1150]